MTERDARVAYPYFFSPDVGRVSPLVELPSKILGRDHKVRGYLPPGYDENTLSRFPVVYMQDGQNLFFPDEAFMGSDWAVDETGDVLRAMSAVEDFLILGLYSGDRMAEYTKPGYEPYARAVAHEIVPEVERRDTRVGTHRRDSSVWGSSLGGVVSFFTVWQHPEVFGSAVCMSSTFSYQDDLIERVRPEPLCSGPAGVTFSANGPNRAKNTTATFPRAGRYTFQVTIADAGGLSATSGIVVSVTPR